MASETAREVMAQVCRRASQEAGMSSPEPWDSISDRRRDQWFRFADALQQAGYELHPLGTGAMIAKLRKAVWAQHRLDRDGPDSGAAFAAANAWNALTDADLGTQS